MQRIQLLALVSWLTFFVTTPCFSRQSEALVINASEKESIFLSYQNVFLESNKKLLLPGDTLRIPFDEHSFRPVPVGFITSQAKPPVFAVLPGDVVSVRHSKGANTYDFSGTHAAELSFYKSVWESGISLNGMYFEMMPGRMPASLDHFLEEWQALREEGDALLAELETLEGVRPAVSAFLRRELKLRVFSLLTLPAIYHKKTGPVREFPQSYRDTVAANAVYLDSLHALPVAASERLLYALRSHVLYRAIEQGSLPTFTTQYKLAKKEYRGAQREWVCYSIIKDAKALQEDVAPLLKDFSAWVAPGNRFLRKLHGDESQVALGKLLLENDVLVTTDGKHMNLADLLARNKGKVLYLDFWASWCRPCIAEFPASKALSEAYKDRGLEIVYLSIDKEEAKWEQASHKFLEGRTLQYRFQDEAKSKLIQHFGVSSIPRYMIVGKDGTVRYADAPRPSDPQLRKRLEALLGN